MRKTMVQKSRFKSGLGLAISLISFALPGLAAAEGEVNVYSYRQPFLIEPMFKAFTEETGIEVNVVFEKKALIERLRAEGKNSPADLVLTVDIGRLNDLVENDLVQPVKTDVLTNAVAANYRDPDGKWYGLTSRARVIYASKDRVKPGEIESYEDLATDKWKGRICTRKGDHVYQIALVAAMIVHGGAEKAEEWLQAVKGNLARKPQGNDRAQVKAIKEGQCDVSLGNSYYMGAMLSDKDQKAWAESVNIVFPNQKGDGTHMNISGMALTKASPNKENAIKLMEFLVGDKAQQMYAEVNHEYPIKAGVAWSDLLASWGQFKQDTLNLVDIAGKRSEALKLVNKVGYNN